MTTKTSTETFTALEVGECYSYNFVGHPSGEGIYLGVVAPIGFLAFQDIPDGPSDNEGELRYFNPALIATLRPATYPSR